MPLPFRCHECEKPTMNVNGICDSCEADLYAQQLRAIKESEDIVVDEAEYFEGTLIPKGKDESDT